MKFLRRLAAPAAALTIAATAATGTVLAPNAGAAELTPADVQGDTLLSEIKPVKTPVTEDSPIWRQDVAEYDDDEVEEVLATSPAMDREVSLALIKAESENAPTIYMLNGADGGEGGANWIQQSDILEFYGEKDINVVIPMEGQFSYYTDWVTDQPQLGGPQKWETFLTQELPGAIEPYLNADNRRAIAGMSMSATSSLLLAQHNQGFYDAVGSFSGCASTLDPVGKASIDVTLDRADTNGEAMWGPHGNDIWAYNDALLNAEDLRGTEIYVSNGSGTAGAWDLPSSPRLEGATELQTSLAMAETIVVGGAIEAVTNVCTHNLNTKLDALEIPADFNFRNTGTHSWGYWQQDLWDSWPTFARAFDMES